MNPHTSKVPHNSHFPGPQEMQKLLQNCRPVTQTRPMLGPASPGVTSPIFTPTLNTVSAECSVNLVLTENDFNLVGTVYHHDIIRRTHDINIHFLHNFPSFCKIFPRITRCTLS